MMVRGMFKNLAWQRFSQEHKEHWKIIETKYGISDSYFTPPGSLDDLAKECVHICRQHLFSSRSYPADYEVPDGWRPWEPNTHLDAVHLEERLTTALCDHLIVTFAYYFYLENLEPRKISDCFNEVFRCKNLFAQGTNNQPTKDEYREIKHDFVKSTWVKYQNYVKSIKSAINRYQEVLENCRKTAEMPWDDLAADLLESFDVPESVPSSKKDCSLGINWLFTLAMACNWINSPFSMKGEKIAIEKERDDWTECLYKFIADNSWSRLLLKEQKGSTRICNLLFYPTKRYADEFDAKTVPILERHFAEVPFVAIACDADKTYSGALPGQTYHVRGSQSQIMIPPDLQFVINCYLLERTFHGYALSSVTAWLRSDLFDRSYGTHIYSQLLMITRLQAPLLHVPLMELLCDTIFEDREWRVAPDVYWINDYINYWNSTALPILEEMFLWGIWSHYSFEEVFVEIEKSIMESGDPCRRCDRLNFYRLVPKAVRRQHLEGYDKNARQQLVGLFNAAYLCGMGCTGYSNDTTQFEVGLCTAFD